MEKFDNFITKYNLRDLFNKTIKMLKYTWKNSLLLSTAFFLVFGLFAAFYLPALFGWLADTLRSQEINSDNLLEVFVLPTIVRFLFFLFVQSLFMVFLRAAISLNTFYIAHGKQIELKDIVLEVLYKKYARLLLQALIIFLMLSAIVFGGMLLLIAISGVITNFFSSEVLNQAQGVLEYIVGVPILILFIWILISFFFAPEVVVYRDNKVFDSIKRSFRLVKGNWWRVVGITLLIYLILVFAINIIVNPITFGVGIGSSMNMAEDISMQNAGVENLIAVFSAYSRMTFAFGLSTLLSGVLYHLIFPVFISLLYLDLEVRKGDLTQSEGQSSTSEHNYTN